MLSHNQNMVYYKILKIFLGLQRQKMRNVIFFLFWLRKKKFENVLFPMKWEENKGCTF